LEGCDSTVELHPQIGSYMRKEVVVISLNAHMTIIPGGW